MAGATTFAALIAEQAPEIVALVEVNAGQQFTGWALTSGIVYEVAVGQLPAVHSFRTIASCKADGVALTQRSSIATVQANPGSFWHDTSAGKLYVSMSDSGTPADNIVVGDFTLYWSGGHPRRGGAVVFNGNVYYPHLDAESLPRVKMQTADPYFGTAITSAGTISLMNDGGGFDVLAVRYVWQDRSITIKLGGDDLPYSEYATIYTGIVQDIGWTEQRFTLHTRDANEDLLVDVPSTLLASADVTTNYNFRWTFSYTNQRIEIRDGRIVSDMPLTRKATDVDADAATKVPLGKPKPILYGVCKKVSGILLAQSNTEIMVMVAGHAIRDIMAIYVDGVKKTSATGSPDDFAVDVDNGIVLAREPIVGGIGSKVLDFDVDGIANTDGTSMDNIADIINDLVVTRGAVTTALDATALDEARFHAGVFKANYRIETRTTLREALEPLLQSAIAYFYLTRSGTYKLVVWAPDQASEVELSDASGDVLDLDVMMDAGRVFKSVTVGYDQDARRSGDSYLRTTATRTETKAITPRAVVFAIDSVCGNQGSAEMLSNRLARFGSKPVRLSQLTTRLKLLNYDLAQPVVINRTRVPKDATTKVHGRTLSMELDAIALTQTLLIDDNRVMREVPYQAFIKANNTALTWAAATAEERILNGFWTEDNGRVVAADASTYGASRYY